MIVKTYKPASPTVEAFHGCDAPVRAIVGAVGTAKTVTALWDIGYILPARLYLNYGITHTRWFIVRRNYTWLMDTDFEAASDWFLHGEYRGVDRTMRIIWPKHGAIDSELLVDLQFRAAETDEDEKKFRSTAATGAWLDESIEIRQVIKDVIITRLGRFPKIADTPANFTPRYLIETTNPCPVDHPMYWQYRWVGPEVIKQPELDADTHLPKWDTGQYNTRKLVQKLPPGPVPPKPPVKGFVGFWQAPGENSGNVRAGYWQQIKELFPESPEMQQMLADGKPGYRPEGKGVYRNYKREIHMAEAELTWMQVPDAVTGGTKGAPLVMGWDNTGLSPAAVLIQRTAPMQFQVLREFYDDRAGLVDFTRIVLEIMASEFPGAEITHYCDPAAFAHYSDVRGGLTSSADMQMQQFGIRILPSRQELHLRISSVDGLLARRDGLLIDPRCVRVLNGFFGGYVYEENPRMGFGEFKDLPKKNKFSHVHDALQYGLVPFVWPEMTDKREDIHETANKLKAYTMGIPVGAEKSYATFDPRRD